MMGIGAQVVASTSNAYEWVQSYLVALAASLSVELFEILPRWTRGARVNPRLLAAQALVRLVAVSLIFFVAWSTGAICSTSGAAIVGLAGGKALEVLLGATLDRRRVVS